MPWSRRPKSGGQAAAGAMPKRGAAEASVLSWCRDLVARVNALEDGMRVLGDAELADVTATLRASYQAGEPLDTLAPEAFAVVRDAVLAAQRREFYAAREQLLTIDDLSGYIRKLAAELAREVLAEGLDSDESPEQCLQKLRGFYPTGITPAELATAAARNAAGAGDPLLALARADVDRLYARRSAELGPEVLPKEWVAAG